MKETATPAEYDPELAYRIHMQRRYQTEDGMNYTQPAKDIDPVTARHRRVKTFAAKYGNALAQSRISLRGRF